ncbi:radical SAM domain-containing protein [Campylobacter volucris]|uniref:Radical SAM domain-containing protein n=1 Tax=Campylobacter volucris TaxID=1031542 RepID=A0AAE6CYN6_9BACT|nr:radical SAM domain-containing protein [Campylobacter volucris]AJC93375.1 radical SAM domain-containing protein [Campylobacter volucris LMG 24379]KAB0579637.1 radical SAM domain-containing protein [Campylobacter volucris]QBL12803.1 radical SAM domain-containing protein [Campylobacter volucris]QEL07588.1 radical SAM superfamily enzyme, MoaA/NifB/PqqE/SkfB family [Campylobacter volucris]TXK66569.1 radical SAM domain-containing protein [Campylobacter volucris]
MINKQDLINNELFQKRYIKANISWYYSYLAGKRGFVRIFRVPYAEFMKKFFLKKYFEKRVRNGKIDIPYLELVLTTKCTLRCESCNNLMQYFSPSNQYTCTLEGLVSSLELLLSKVDSIARVRIIGGEPLMFKDLPKLIEYLDGQKKILTFNLVTNATIDFKDELIDKLKKSKKARKITISDYTKSPNLKIPLKQESIINKLKFHKIPYSMDSSGENATWSDPERIYKRNRNKEEIIKNYLNCQMPCVSLMTSQGLENKSLAPNGAIFVCPISSSLSRLKGLDEFNGDFINLDDDRERILEFYTQNFYKSCDYCRDFSKPNKKIPIAIQTDKVLKLEKD